MDDGPNKKRAMNSFLKVEEIFEGEIAFQEFTLPSFSLQLCMERL